MDLLDDTLVPNVQSNDAKVFYYKMKADFMRYIAEYSSSDQRTQVAQKALRAYEEAQGQARQCLPNTHPLKLGLALNHSVFHYEIL